MNVLGAGCEVRGTLAKYKVEHATEDPGAHVLSPLHSGKILSMQVENQIQLLI